MVGPVAAADDEDARGREGKGKKGEEEPSRKRSRKQGERVRSEIIMEEGDTRTCLPSKAGGAEGKRMMEGGGRKRKSRP